MQVIQVHKGVLLSSVPLHASGSVALRSLSARLGQRVWAWTDMCIGVADKVHQTTVGGNSCWNQENLPFAPVAAM